MKSSLKIIILVSRLIAGLVFIFSGFVKAVDPLGSTYKFIDYFNAFGLPWLESFAFPLSFILSGLEFLIGVCLVIFIHKKLASWGALVFMVVFTPLTLWLALSNPVHDCGCFGDALILTNWQTFFKNMLILVFVLIAFFYRKRVTSWAKPKTEWIISVVVAMLITVFSWYNYEHLPILDFRPYKVGTYIPDKMRIPAGAASDVYTQFFILKDTTTGKQIEIESNEYMTDSSYWCANSKWKFISSTEPKLISRGYQPPIHDFTIMSLSGVDSTQAVLSNEGYYFIIVAYNLQKTNVSQQSKLNDLCAKVHADKHSCICLTASTSNDILEYQKKWNVPYQFFQTDPITLKTIIRANPGLVLLHKGTILAKWHSNDIPAYETIKETFLKQ